MNREQAVSIRIISILQNCNTLIPVGLTVCFLVIRRGLLLLNNVRRLLDSFLFLRWEIKVIWKSRPRLLHCLLYLQDLIQHISNKKTIKHIWTVTSLQLSLQRREVWYLCAAMVTFSAWEDTSWPSCPIWPLSWVRTTCFPWPGWGRTGWLSARQRQESSQSHNKDFIWQDITHRHSQQILQ